MAGYWCAEQAPRAVRTCHHLHGGLGMDVSYPLHRFSSLVANLVRFLGGADYRLERLACSPELTPDQLELRDELRAYFARPDVARRARRTAHRAARHRLPRGGAPDGPRPLARGGLAGQVRRARLRPGGAADLRGRGGPRRRAAARRHAADRRPDPAGARHARAAGLLPAEDPGRRGALRDRLHRAGGGHGPGGAAYQGGAGRGRSTSSTGRRSSPPAPTRPTTSGWPAGPTRTRRGTRGSPSSSSTPPTRGSPGPRSSPSTAPITSTRPTTRACGCRSRCGSARRTTAGG